MRLGELLRVALRALLAHKLRSVLTTLGIVISVWTIVSVVSVIWGMNDYVMGTVFSLSPDVFVVSKVGMVRTFEEYIQALKRKPITRREVERLGELCESCAEVGEQLAGSLEIRVGNRRIRGVQVLGTSPNYAGLQGLDVESGRYFTAPEDAGRAPVAVIGWRVRDELYPRLDPLGRELLVGGVPHRVIGILRKQGSVLGQDRDLLVYLPIRTAEARLGPRDERDAQNAVLVRARGGVDGVAAAGDEVVQVFRWLRETPLRGEDPVGIVTAESIQGVWRAISLSTFLFLSLVSGVSLVVGGIVVANIMLVSVVERTREIGLRLALGARPRDVRRQFLLEAILLGVAGGLLGAAAGALTAQLVNAHTPVPAVVRLVSLVEALLVAAVSGLAAGLYPARKASRLTPVEALRYE